LALPVSSCAFSLPWRFGNVYAYFIGRTSTADPVFSTMRQHGALVSPSGARRFSPDHQWKPLPSMWFRRFSITTLFPLPPNEAGQIPGYDARRRPIGNCWDDGCQAAEHCYYRRRPSLAAVVIILPCGASGAALGSEGKWTR
jgi:hypothetical protein